MDSPRFERLARSIPAAASRRLIVPLGLAALVAAAAEGIEEAGAKAGKKRKARCRKVGAPCQLAKLEQCCSGFCGCTVEGCTCRKAGCHPDTRFCGAAPDPAACAACAAAADCCYGRCAVTAEGGGVCTAS